MKVRFSEWVWLSIVLLLSACGGSDGSSGREAVPFEASLRKEDLSWMVSSGWNGPMISTQLVVTSRVEGLRVNDVSLNRGNCRLMSGNGLPASLAFGEELKVAYFEPCSVVEADVFTNRGTWKVGFR